LDSANTWSIRVMIPAPTMMATRATL
jgi:hypothetical protein